MALSERSMLLRCSKSAELGLSRRNTGQRGVKQGTRKCDMSIYIREPKSVRRSVPNNTYVRHMNYLKFT